MRILEMTATFGKLEAATLTPEPGLCILQAPNEWGKSTWCAFMLAMFYGIDTRSHSTKNALADKEHYAPWSGSPMAGRIRLEHQGTLITIERSSKGRIPFGSFHAYETLSGLPIPGLTAENCGMTLLGVERDVFMRTAFLRLTDLPVTQNDALRRRLNALVTTGDESGAAEALDGKLLKLKNAIRSNSRNGLLPQLENEQAEILGRLENLRQVTNRVQQLEQRLQQLETYRTQLQHHKQALAYARSLEAKRRLDTAMAEEQELRARLEALNTQCASLPQPEQLRQIQQKLEALRRQRAALSMDAALEPGAPDDLPPLFGEQDPDRLDQKIARDEKDRARCITMLQKKIFPLWPFGLLLILGGIAAAFRLLIPGIICAAIGLGMLIFNLIRQHRYQKLRLQYRLTLSKLENLYGSPDPLRWKEMAAQYRARLEEHRQASEQYRLYLIQRAEQFETLQKQIRAITDGCDEEAFLQDLASGIRLWEELGLTRRELQRSTAHRAALEAALPQAAPIEQDELDFTEPETDRLLSDQDTRIRQLQQELGNARGRMEVLGDREELFHRRQQLQERIQKLHTMLASIDLARNTLAESISELQRRFAPRLTRRASELFSRLTDGRYDRMTLDKELTTLCASSREEVLRGVLWRSDGTTDQLYLALRLALWEELAPEAPLILDDALIRFDDQRLKKALELLSELGQKRQILLFTCQSREKNILGT